MKSGMSVTPEMLAAYADGELGADEAARVAAAVAGDPALAERLAMLRSLRGALAAHFASLLDEPVPAGWGEMIASHQIVQDRPPRDNVVSLASVRAARAEPAPRRRWSSPAAGFAIAASLMLGVMLGAQMQWQGPVVLRGGALMAGSRLALNLDSQLAAAPTGTDTRILASFRRSSGEICRAFTGATVAGIACRAGLGWHIERLQPGAPFSGSPYRQAGSADADLMAAAQVIMQGEPMNAAQEADAKAHGWR